MQCTCFTVPTTSGRPQWNPLVWACQWPSSQSLAFTQLSYNDSLWAYGITKSHGEHGLDYRDGEELSCAYLSQIVCDKDGVVVHCTGGNAIGPISSVLADEISSWTPLKSQNSLPCWLFAGNPVHGDHASAVKKRAHQKFVGAFALSGLVGSGRSSVLPLGTLSLGLWVISVDPAFIVGH